jgi:hypothetical protein
MRLPSAEASAGSQPVKIHAQTAQLAPVPKEKTSFAAAAAAAASAPAASSADIAAAASAATAAQAFAIDTQLLSDAAAADAEHSAAAAALAKDTASAAARDTQANKRALHVSTISRRPLDFPFHHIFPFCCVMFSVVTCAMTLCALT